MAKEIAKLLRTEMAADVTALPMLAKLLQSYGRKGDKMLAHITPEEAQRLEDEGGSGTINPHTGLPEYYDEGDFGVYDSGGQEMSQQDVAQAYPDLYPQGDVQMPGEATRFAPSEGGMIPTYQPMENIAAPQFAAAPSFAMPAVQDAGLTPPPLPTGMVPAAETTPPPPEEKGFLDKLGLTKEQALRLGLGSVSALATGLAGQRGINQARQAREDVAALGRPYQETGKRLQEQALRGELTPAGQQQVQAAQAQLAQGAERRGGVGAQQAATQIAALRQNLLDQQYNYGLKVAQIGDSYAANAIRTGLTQDQEMARMMANLASTVGNVYGVMPPQSPARG
jgi:hypothetical protein